MGFQQMLFAQERCGSTIYQKKNAGIQREAEPLMQIESGKAPLNGIVVQEENTPLPTRKIIIPVVVHILYRSDNENISTDQVLSQLESMNADFNQTNADLKTVPAVFANRVGNAQIRFELAKVDPDGRATNGIVRKKTNVQLWTDNDKIKYSGHDGSTGWDSRHYLNIWVGSLVNGLLGYASFPGGDVEKDGIVIRYDIFGTRGRLAAHYNKGRTLTHEVGHWLNLKHIWGDLSCGDDGIEDTPRQRSYNQGCPSFPRVNAGCDNGPSGDMFMNFMDFTDDACMNMFTTGQTELMRAEFSINGRRMSLLDSKGLGEPWNMSAASVENLTESANIKVYPNPAISSIQISSSLAFPLTGKRYTIINPSGKVLMTGQMLQQNQIINIQHLSSGLYFICIDGQVQKWIKSK